MSWGVEDLSMFFVNEFVCLQPREIHDVILLRHNYSFLF
jgi:hypothetical protein